MPTSSDRAALIASWRPTLVALDPFRRLTATEIGRLYATRRRAPSAMIEDQLLVEESTPVTSRFLVCGARGSGKSTELVRIGARLNDSYTVLHVDVAPAWRPGMGTLSWVLLLGFAALHRLQEWHQQPLAALDSAPEDSGAGRLRATLGRLSAGATRLSELVGAVGAVLAVVPGGSVVGAGVSAAAGATRIGVTALSRLSPLLGLRDTGVGGAIGPEKRDDALAVVDAINQVLHELHGVSGLRPLLLADGIDKLKDFAAVAQALADEELVEALDAPLVLTGPAALRHDPRFNGTRTSRWTPHILYNVPVVNPSGAPDAEGLGTLGQVLALRTAAEQLASRFPPEAVDFAAQMSSGIVREFMEILKKAGLEAIRAGRSEAVLSDVKEAVTQVRHALQNQLTSPRIDLLRTVLTARTVPGEPEAETLLFENFIACYPNGDVWYRPHEALVRWLEGRGGE